LIVCHEQQAAGSLSYDAFSAHAVLAVQAGYVSVSLLAEGNLKGTQLENQVRKFQACAKRNIKI
jgi:hypothetical protein